MLWSNTASTCRPGGRSLSSRTAFFTASTICRVLPPGTRSTFRYTVSWPATETDWVAGEPESSTRAMSRMSTGRPWLSLTKASPMSPTFAATALV